jgi:hypothetical protein
MVLSQPDSVFYENMEANIRMRTCMKVRDIIEMIETMAGILSGQEGVIANLSIQSRKV